MTDHDMTREAWVSNLLAEMDQDARLRRRTRTLKAVAMVLITIAAITACAALITTAARGDSASVYRTWTKADVWDVAAIHVSKLPKKQQKYIRYFDLSAVAPKARCKALGALGFTINSLSRHDEIILPQEVYGTEGAIAWIDLSYYKIDPEAFDKLGEKGSGPAPFPEPYYHHIVDEIISGEVIKTPYQVTVRYRDKYGYYYDREETRYEITHTPDRRVRKTLVGAHLNKGTALGLTALTESANPVYEYHWFIANALVEPRYHEILGLDDTEASVKKLAAVNEKLADKLGAQARGAVLVSEVAHRNRILERTPTPHRYGRGTYQRSYDFKTSIRAQDALKDTLADDADANEIIFTLPNGLLAYSVQAKGKRLDKADGDVALNNRSKFRDRQVRTALHCIACHLPDKGWIEVDDEVRQLSMRPVKLLADALDRDGNSRGEKIRQKYLAVDINELLRADQAVVEAAVSAATGKMTCATTAKLVTEAARTYTDELITLSRLAIELGYSEAAVLKALNTEGLDPVFAVIASGRKARRDQVEAGLAQLAAILAKGGY